MAGKGDKPRPRVIDDSEWERRWRLAFEKGDSAGREKQDRARDEAGAEGD